MQPVLAGWVGFRGFFSDPTDRATQTGHTPWHSLPEARRHDRQSGGRHAMESERSRQSREHTHGQSVTVQRCSRCYSRPSGDGRRTDAIEVLRRAVEERGNKLRGSEYNATTWSARTWSSYFVQRVSYALMRDYRVVRDTRERPSASQLVSRRA